ncbi:hypothetical protein F3I27_14255 [Pantoea sp. Bo_2]|uniref:Uncharacterized protein n=1 Tax=Candidatus Pantoea gossypiicola TaxID=2608008 RepID=A0AB34CHU4_9GAMM|nr:MULTISPECIES: hypothetical protein [Pantoea]KAA5944823.1 hypothetical protein F3I57_12450 [Pantoea sp. VH_3]KAA5951990.1 hypothetical protein F3I56_12930 [Pantoea sp. VH_25]KAA5954237.1 hypothetical protein F3I55_15305 [Pantoea sp. VH_24]KAA5958196.1 hypothetical protein F3I53_15600 [Pantoea sp. VH_16]KAA5963555.1 hypothetical protein F3I54_15455 [Pantoea sp. VH_18]
MINIVKGYEEWTRSVVEKKLLRVNGVIYSLENHDYIHPQQLQLVFSEVEEMESFKCGKDGSTLELTDLPLQGSDLGEYGKETVVDISHIYPIVNYIGKILLKVFLMSSSLEDAFVGVKLVFEGELSLFIMNVGDEINMLESLSSSYEQDEGIKYQQL